MTGFGETIDQPSSPFKPQWLKKVTDVLGINKPKETTEPTTAKAEKIAEKTDWNVVARRILQAERDIAIAQIRGENIAPRRSDQLTLTPRRGKIVRAHAAKIPVK